MTLADTRSGVSRKGIHVVADVETGVSTSAKIDSSLSAALFSFSLPIRFSVQVQRVRRDFSGNRKSCMERSNVCC